MCGPAWPADELVKAPRRYALLAAVMKAHDSAGDTARLNVVLEPCRR